MKYDLMLFDMDGVMTGELCYWEAAALTVWEFLYQEDIPSILARKQEIFNTVFCNRETIQYTKRAGVNCNHDLAYVVAALARKFFGEDRPFEAVREWLKQSDQSARELYAYCEELWGTDWKHQGRIWTELHAMFQSWYLGDGNKKTGLIKEEQPLFEPNRLAELLSALNDAGVVCGIGTGRPREEIVPHLERWKLIHYFHPQRIITQTEVTEAQAWVDENHLNLCLSKPHFFIFGKGVAGLSASCEDVLNRQFDPNLLKKTLVVGDAGADIFAAKNLGADFAAVLTGVTGKAERSFFEQCNAEYIFDDVFGIKHLL